VATPVALIFRHADENVSTAQIVKIIGEGAHRVPDGFRVPALLKFQTLPLHGLSVQNVINVDRQMHRRLRIDQNLRRESQIIYCRQFRSAG
jgi:hypothetical protein